jgi:transposase-like protein
MLWHISFMSYILKQFNAQFPNDLACLDFMFKTRWPHGLECPGCGKKHSSFHHITGRRAYSCAWCAHHVYPTAGTIFHKSSTSLHSWFFAIFLMSSSKNGVAAKELQRHIGVTYKTAWRMNHEIRKLMADGKPGKLMGVVEADETYIGGVRTGKRGRGAAGKTAVIGLVERDGKVIAKVIDAVTTANVFGHITRNVDISAALYSDELAVYRYAPKWGYKHRKVNHGEEEYVRGDVHTNTIEGFWSQLKRSVNGTHHFISRKYLQKYVDEFSFRYNHRKAGAIFPFLAARLGDTLPAAA